MATTRQLVTAATRHQVFLERYKAGEVRGWMTAVDNFAKATRDVLTALDEDKISDLTRAKLTKLLAELKEANEAALGKGVESFNEQLEKLAGYEASWEARALQTAYYKPGALDLTIPNAQEAYKAAVAQPLSTSGARLNAFIDNWTTGEVTRINNVVQKAWGEGWTVQQLARTIRGTKALSYKDGIIATTRRNAEAVARTSIQHVASMGRQALWDANSDVVTGYRWVSTLDSRTTQQCRSLDGQTFKLGEGPVPPIHIGCRSTTVAELDPALDFLDEGATRASKDGYVPANQSYYEWLKGQPPEFQKEAIGATRAKLFQNGGLTAEEFAKLNVNQSYEPLTLEQMRALEPVAFARAGIPE